MKWGLFLFEMQVVDNTYCIPYGLVECLARAPRVRAPSLLDQEILNRNMDDGCSAMNDDAVCVPALESSDGSSTASSSTENDPISSPLFALRPIANAGRGLIATFPIPKNTLLLNSGPPAFHNLFKLYAKETCAWCFRWDRGRTLAVREAGVGKVFCDEQCLGAWREDEGDVGEEAGKVVAGWLRKRGRGTQEDEVMGIVGERPEEEEVEAAWREGEKRAVALRRGAECGKSMTKIERKLVNGIVRKMEESVDADILGYILCAVLFHARHPEKWREEVLPLAHDSRPYKTKRDLEVAVNSFLQLSTILPSHCLNIHPEICRTIFEVDNHNAFGIRAGGEDSEEYMGYGVFPIASYFNHSCEPNVSKKRIGREWEFRANRDLEVGEELCITYLGGDEKDLGVGERRMRLEGAWGFACACARCRREGG